MRCAVFFLVVTFGLASYSQTINSPQVSNGTLNGNYAFSFNGYNNGVPYLMVGAFAADGQGNITSGKLDLNNGAGEYNDPSQCRGNLNCPIPQIVQSGSGYNLGAGGGLGTITIIALDHLGNQTTFQFEVAIQASGGCTPGTTYTTCGRIIQRDSNNPQTYGSGVLIAQNSAYFPINSFFPGNFALQVVGIDPSGARYAAAGALGTNPVTLVDIDCNGNGWKLGGCPLDIDDNGQSAPDPIKGSFSSDIDLSSGRGNFVNMVLSSDPHGLCSFTSSCGFVYYIVNSAEMLLLSSDPLSKPANVTSWLAVRQSQNAGWSLSSLSGWSVMELTAVDPSGNNPDVVAGHLMSAGNGSATFNFDENDGGTLRQQSLRETYTIDSSGVESGRMVLTGGVGPLASRRVLYLYAPNSAFVVGADSKVSSGDLQPEFGAVFSNYYLDGLYAGGTVAPARSSVTNSAIALTSDGVGHITATQYTSGPAGPGGPNTLTLTYQVDPTGRAVVHDQNGNEFGVLYIIGPNKSVLVPAGAAPALTDFASGGPN